MLFFTNFCIFLTFRHRKTCSMHLKILPSYSDTLTWPIQLTRFGKKSFIFEDFPKNLLRGGFLPYFGGILGPPSEKVSIRLFYYWNFGKTHKLAKSAKQVGIPYFSFSRSLDYDWFVAKGLKNSLTIGKMWYSEIMSL